MPALDAINTNEGAFPWCDACKSWHHPDNPTCVLRAPNSAPVPVTDEGAPVQLTTTQVIAALCTLGRQIGTAQQELNRIPESPRPNDCLIEIIRSCESTIACARRLLANDKGRKATNAQA
jgi:hypothetical protein